MKHVIIVGRGHGGTRAAARTLHESGFFMSDNLNDSYDLVPGALMYDAVRLVGERVRYTGDGWDFADVLNTPLTQDYIDLVRAYLEPLQGRKRIAWKLPESVLGLPWLVQLFPNAYFIHWVRDGRDNILGEHGTDDLSAYHVPFNRSDNRIINAAQSWAYHLAIVAATPKPKRWLTVRLRDFALNQEVTLRRMSRFLRADLTSIPVSIESIGRWQQHADTLTPALPILQPYLEAYDYL